MSSVVDCRSRPRCRRPAAVGRQPSATIARDPTAVDAATSPQPSRDIGRDQRPADRVRRQRRDHADAHVEGLARGRPGRPRRVGRPARRPAAATRSSGRRVPTTESGTTRARLAASPPPVMCDIACTSTASASARQRQRVEAGRLEQLLAQRAAELGDVAVESPAGLLEEHVPHERVAVGVQAARCHRDDDVAGTTRSAPSSLSASTTPVAAPATSYSSGASRPGCSAVSPPSSARAALGARLRRCP